MTEHPKCHIRFQTDVAMNFACGKPEGHKGPHGWVDQQVLSDARDVTAGRKIAVVAGETTSASLEGNKMTVTKRTWSCGASAEGISPLPTVCPVHEGSAATCAVIPDGCDECGWWSGEHAPQCSKSAHRQEPALEQALDEIDTLCQAIEGYRSGSLTADGAWHYVIKARALLAALRQSSAPPTKARPIAGGVLLEEMRMYLDTLTITGENIGDIRRSLFMPWDCFWNGIVRDETARRETPALPTAAPSETERNKR